MHLFQSFSMSSWIFLAPFVWCVRSVINRDSDSSLYVMWLRLNYTFSYNLGNNCNNTFIKKYFSVVLSVWNGRRIHTENPRHELVYGSVKTQDFYHEVHHILCEYLLLCQIRELQFIEKLNSLRNFDKTLLCTKLRMHFPGHFSLLATDNQLRKK